MKIKKVFRYYCDFCKKSGGSKYHLQKHEEHCTLNPNRKCGVCEAMGGTPVPMNELLNLLPDLKNFVVPVSDNFFSEEDSYSMPEETAKEILIKLREATDGCPACIMAALRQKGIFLSLIPQFDYKEEMEDFWRSVHSQEFYG